MLATQAAARRRADRLVHGQHRPRRLPAAGHPLGRAGGAANAAAPVHPNMVGMMGASELLTRCSALGPYGRPTSGFE